MDDAIERVNLILGEDANFKLIAGWNNSARHRGIENDADTLVYIVDVNVTGKYGISFVPQGRKCILVDSPQVHNAIYIFSGRNPRNDGKGSNMEYLGDMPAYVYMMTYLLLHEVGHLEIEFFKDDKYLVKQEKQICSKDMNAFGHYFVKDSKNASCTTNKVIEILADKFAAAKIKDASTNSSERERYETALRVMQTILIAATNIVFQRADSSESQNRSQQSFFDKGYSHPNTELRLLLVLTETSPDSRWMVDDFLDGRSGQIEKDNKNEMIKLPSLELARLLGVRETPWTDKMTATEILGERGEAIVLDDLLAILNQKNTLKGKRNSQVRTLRNEVIKSIGMIGDERAVSHLISRLNEKDSSVTTRTAIIQSLGQIGDAKAVMPLIRIAESEDRWDKIAAIEALGLIGDGRAVKPLINLLSSESGLALSTLVNSLAKLGDPSALPALRSVLPRITGHRVKDRTMIRDEMLNDEASSLIDEINKAIKMLSAKSKVL